MQQKKRLYSDLTGMGSDAELSVSSFTWTERVIDKYQTQNGITRYAGKIQIKNLGNATTYITSVEIPATSFTFEANATLLDGMSPSQSKTLTFTLHRTNYHYVVPRRNILLRLLSDTM